MNFYWIFLSYQLNENHYAYGNGDRIKITQTNSILNGDTSNNTHLSFPTHFGTHIDYPFHFDKNGKRGDEFLANDFISKKVQIIDKSNSSCIDYLYKKKDFVNTEFISDTEILIIKTGMGNYFHEDLYWDANPGFEPKLANYFKQKMPKLRIIGFDSISLTGRKYKNQGKKAHKEFLIKHNILIVEDMNLSQLKSDTIINEMIISPLRFENADGAPATVYARISE